MRNFEQGLWLAALALWLLSTRSRRTAIAAQPASGTINGLLGIPPSSPAADSLLGYRCGCVAVRELHHKPHRVPGADHHKRAGLTVAAAVDSFVPRAYTRALRGRHTVEDSARTRVAFKTKALA